MNTSTVDHLDLTVYQLRFTVEAVTFIHFGPQAGAQLRGALWAALQRFACTDPRARTDSRHADFCPMCRLMHRETHTGARGINPARPFAIQPPLGGDYYQPGDPLRFGISLFGDSADLLPYIVQAVYHMGDIGVGYGRGRFAMRGIESVNPFTGQSHPLLANGRLIPANLIPLDTAQITTAAAPLPASSLRLRFLTPAQIVADGRFDNHPVFPHLIARLLERAQSIDSTYTHQPQPRATWQATYHRLTTAAASVRLSADYTRWVHVRSGSRRDNSNKALSGFVGDAVFAGDLAPFQPWLLWGQVLHIGKNAVKGSGWYEIVTA